MRAPVSELPTVLERVSVHARGTRILDEVSVSFMPGSPSAILGPNGAGKTTLIRVAMGLLRPTHGQVSWGGNPDPQPRRRAVVFQRPVMLKRSVQANIAFALGLFGHPREARRQRIAELLEQASLAPLARRPARRLSGGEQQRLALARALARDPEILFLDEPTANLDPAATKSVEALIRTVAGSGIKIVLATHDLGQARPMCSDVVFLAGGRLIEHAPAEKFFVNPGTPQAAAFLRGDIVE